MCACEDGVGRAERACEGGCGQSLGQCFWGVWSDPQHVGERLQNDAAGLLPGFVVLPRVK